MTNVRWWHVALGAGVLLTALSPILAPRSCTGGNETFFAVGVLSIIVVGSVPFYVAPSGTALAKIGRGIAGMLLVASAWISLFLAFPFRIMCRMF